MAKTAATVLTVPKVTAATRASVDVPAPWVRLDAMLPRASRAALACLATVDNLDATVAMASRATPATLVFPAHLDLTARTAARAPRVLSAMMAATVSLVRAGHDKRREQGE